MAEDYRSTLLGVAWTLSSLSTVFVGLRYFCRIYYGHKLGWDDFWAAVTLVFSFAMSIDWAIYANAGGGVSQPLTSDQQNAQRLILAVCETLCTAALALSKLTVAALILRLQDPSRWRTRVLWAVCSIAVAWGLIQIGLVWGQCQPEAATWNPAGNPGVVCLDPRSVTMDEIASSAYWALADFCLAAISVQMVWGLELPRGRKIVICVLLSICICAGIIALVRTAQIAETLLSPSPSTHDIVTLLVLNALEVNVLIVTASVPAIAPLFEDLCGRRLSRHAKLSGSYSAYSTDRKRRAGDAQHDQARQPDELRGTAHGAYPGRVRPENSDIEARGGNSSVEWTSEVEGWPVGQEGSIQVRHIIEVSSTRRAKR